MATVLPGLEHVDGSGFSNPLFHDSFRFGFTVFGLWEILQQVVICCFKFTVSWSVSFDEVTKDYLCFRMSESDPDWIAVCTNGFCHSE